MCVDSGSRCESRNEKKGLRKHRVTPFSDLVRLQDSNSWLDLVFMVVRWKLAQKCTNKSTNRNDRYFDSKPVSLQNEPFRNRPRAAIHPKADLASKVQRPLSALLQPTVIGLCSHSKTNN